MSEKLEIIYNDIVSFLAEISDELGEPVSPSVNEIAQIQNEIINSVPNNDSRIAIKFFMIIRVKGDVIFNHNTENYLDLPSNYSLLDFFKCVNNGTETTSFLEDYLLWARAAYILSERIISDNCNKNLAYKIRIPMKLRDGYVYWVQQDSRPFEFDRNNHMVSHLNSYTVICRYHETQPHGLLAEIYYNELINDDMSKLISEIRFNIQPFMPTVTQRDVLNYFHKYPNATVNGCANELKYPLNTIKKYISDSQRKKGIMDMARSSFPAINITKLKDVVVFLDKIGWYN